MRRLIGLLVFTCLATGCKSREEKLQAAEEQGSLLAATKARVVKGVGEALKTEGKDAAQSVTEGSGEVVKAVGAGFDKSLSQVKLAVHQELQPKGVGVVIEAEHHCMTMRGVNTPGASLSTSSFLGELRSDPRTRQEFLQLVRGGKAA